MYLSRELTGQRTFTLADRLHLKARLAVLDGSLRGGVPSHIHKGVLYRIKLDRVVKGKFNAIILEFLFQSGNRVRYILSNGLNKTDMTLYPKNYNVRPDRIIDLSGYKTWREVKELIKTGLVESEDSRKNVDFYRTRVRM